MTTESNPAAELYGALAKAQGQFLPIVKNREVSITMKTGGSYRFRYADLEEIISKTRPALSANGICLMQTIEHGQNGPLLVCRLAHAGGGMVASEVAIVGIRDMGDPKSFGAAITYVRRYMVTAMLGVAADDDLDEDGQEMGEVGGMVKRAPDAGTRQPPAAQEHAMLQAGRDASMAGMESLTAWWGGLTAGDRKELNTEFPRLRTAAQAADRGANNG